MKTVGSEFLTRSKPYVRKLIDLLSVDYKYVSVLGTDTKGKVYRISKTGTEVNDAMLAERGFVVRLHNGVNYSEYSFNEIDEDKISDIVSEIKANLHKLAIDINTNEYAILQEEEITKQFYSDSEVDPMSMSPEEIIRALTEIKELGCSLSELVVNFRAALSFTRVSKIFLSAKKDLEQSYTYSEASMFCVARREEKTKYYFDGFSGMKGFEVMKEMKEQCPRIVDQCIRLLDAKPAEPGEYEVICAPDITGLIAHEAFGHGVEMDMFVKGRAKGAEYMGKQVSSSITTMHDGAKAASHVSSYLFDDEGTLGSDTIIIQDGILKNGISDLLSALKLGTAPTGNGKRQSFERKAYARMTNTFFAPGTDSYEAMLASIRHGYQIEGLYSGMEDPKNWGIQCIALLGREIVDGKLTGNLISPVVMTGFVPELLQSISMVSGTVELSGGGFCGKGYKEFVKTANGGPYIKAKVRLG